MVYTQSFADYVNRTMVFVNDQLTHIQLRNIISDRAIVLYDSLPLQVDSQNLRAIIKILDDVATLIAEDEYVYSYEVFEKVVAKLLEVNKLNYDLYEEDFDYIVNKRLELRGIV
ncbi:MAG: hypothetical protein EOM41_08520 [Bacilli bacterium]|nr:hypothetical protein [Bacilli bacterium]